MKKIIGLSVFTFLIGFSSIAHAQEKDKTTGQEIKSDVKSAGHEIKKGAKKVGHKTAEVASKGKAKITDEEYKDKVGPNGEKIYIDNHSRYYWVDKKGHRNYTTEGELKAKND